MKEISTENLDAEYIQWFASKSNALELRSIINSKIEKKVHQVHVNRENAKTFINSTTGLFQSICDPSKRSVMNKNDAKNKIKELRFSSLNLLKESQNLVIEARRPLPLTQFQNENEKNFEKNKKKRKIMF